MFEDIGEPAPEFRDSENSKNATNNNRYTQVENDILFNPVEGLNDENEEDDEKENKDNKENESLAKTSTNSKNKKEIKKLKIILLGEKGVGKSSLIKRYVSNKFHSFEDKQDLEINIKNIDIDDNTSAELSIYDTTNEQKLGKITKNYYKDAHGAIIVFDLTNKNTFNRVKYWLKEINSNAPRDIVLCLLGNKADLTSDRNVAYEDAKTVLSEMIQDGCYRLAREGGVTNKVIIYVGYQKAREGDKVGYKGRAFVHKSYTMEIVTNVYSII